MSARVFGHGPEGDVAHAINRLPSFAWCHDLGADGIECDVRLAADGELVVVHDPARPDGRPVSACRREDLPDWIPSLADVLDVCAGMVVNVELKNFPRDPAFDPGQRVTHRLLELLAERDDRDRVIVSCFDTGAIDLVRSSSSVDTALLLLSRRPADELLDRVVRHGHTMVHPYDTMVDEAFMASARARHVSVNVWFGDLVPAERLEELVDLGVDGLITDDVVTARRLVDGGAA